jgi:glycosyltransferase involved in cell wall biosynthesis
MRTAIVHYWLLGMRGGEKVLESLCRILPNSDIFTLFYDPERVSPFIRSHVVKTSFLNPLKRHYRSLLPLMPLALESLDLRNYDLVVSSESGPAKGILTSSQTEHVCYCHSPMRYLWDLYPDYLHEWTRSSCKRVVMAPLANYLRLWDANSAARVDKFIANSRNVQGRIWKAYRRSSYVVHPPVVTDHLYSAPSRDYWLVVSELVAYKRIADAVRSFSRSGRRLKIVGNGPEYKELRKLAGPTVEFCGRVSDADLAHLYAHCQALVMPGEEDFGIVAVEALASGKPVIALGKGGVLESVPQNCSHAGFFYPEPGEQSLELAIQDFEARQSRINPEALQLHAQKFSREAFEAKLQRHLLPKIAASKATNVLSLPAVSHA